MLRGLATTLRGHRAGSGWLVHCPVPGHGKGRGDRSPSLSICEGLDGRVLFKCHAGCDHRDVLAEMRRRGLLGDQAPREKQPAREIRKPQPIEPDSDAIALWRSAEPIQGSIGERYLLSRGITTCAPPSLRFLPAYEHIAGRVYLPAMIAALQAADRRVIGVQITMIDPRGDRKAQVRFPRKTIGKMHDGAVRLGPAGEALGPAEGIETGMSAQQLFGFEMWCALGAARLHSVAIPDDVRELHVFADNDEAGRTAAEKAVEAHRRRRVIVHLPTCNDWNEALMARLTERAA